MGIGGRDVRNSRTIIALSWAAHVSGRGLRSTLLRIDPTYFSALVAPEFSWGTLPRNVLSPFHASLPLARRSRRSPLLGNFSRGLTTPMSQEWLKGDKHTDISLVRHLCLMLQTISRFTWCMIVACLFWSWMANSHATDAHRASSVKFVIPVTRYVASGTTRLARLHLMSVPLPSNIHCVLLGSDSCR